MASKIEGIEEENLREMYIYEKKNTREIADRYGVDQSTISRRMQKYGIDRRSSGGGEKIYDIPKDDLRRMYEDEKLVMEEIANRYGVSQPTIWNRMQEYGIPSRNNIEAHIVSENHRQYSINEDFFKTWTPESAWMFGWKLGDGSVYHNTLRFSIGRKDKEVLYKFRDIIDGEQLVKDIVDYDKRYNKHRYRSKINFCSYTLTSDLKQLHYEDVPKEYLSDFIRGFWEAEGSVSKESKRNKFYITTNFAQKDEDILRWIWYILKDSKNTIRGGCLDKNKADCWHLIFKEADSVSLYHYLYDNCGILFLKRKKDRFEELMTIKKYL